MVKAPLIIFRACQKVAARRGGVLEGDVIIRRRRVTGADVRINNVDTVRGFVCGIIGVLR